MYRETGNKQTIFARDLGEIALFRRYRPCRIGERLRHAKIQKIRISWAGSLVFIVQKRTFI